MNGLLDIRSVKNMARFISACFLFVHMAMIALFWHCGVTPMVFFNAGSILFYALSFLIIEKGMLGLYTDLMYIEVVAHMTCAILFTGWSSDFQVALVGMSCVVFFAEYLERYLNIRHAHALPLCVLGAISYLVTCFISSFRPAPYIIPEPLSLYLRLALGAVVFFVSIMVLQVFVSEATRSEKALTKRLLHDKLTGLPNRYYVTDYLRKLSQDGNLDKYWIALADIDDFKHINDTCGHNCGDFVLRTIAHTLQEGLSGAQVCRWGGEEFLAVGLIGDGMDSQKELLDRCRRTIAGLSLWYEEHRITVTITLGVEAYKAGYTASEWINAADEKLYKGKKNGKNQVVM